MQQAHTPTTRREATQSGDGTSRVKPGHLRQLRALAQDFVASWRSVPRARSVPQDLLAGLTVAAVALPLNIGLAIASGMPPSAGLIAGALGGGIAAVLGSSQYQVSGPAAALTVMVLALFGKFGVSGVAAATIFVGAIEIVLALVLAGKIVKYVPESVLAGFTTGVGLKLLDQQLPELLGFPEVVDWAAKSAPTTIDLVTMMHRPKWLHDVSWLAAVSGVFVIFVVTTMRPFRRFPAAIVSIAVITFVAAYLKWDVERVGDIPSQFPAPALPRLRDEQWIDLLAQATPLALLAAAESLLSASAVDRMAEARTPHDPNVELVGQGIANIVVGFFAGMPVTGVVARSGVNVQSGGKTRLSALVHAVFLTCAVLFLGRFISQVPLAALAGLLCVIGFRLIELNTLVHLYKASKPEALAFVVTMAGTVSGHLMTGLVVGLVIHFANRWLHRHEEAARAELEASRKIGIRAVIDGDKAATRRREHGGEPAATLIRRGVVGEDVEIALDRSLRADHGPLHIGTNAKVSDGVAFHSVKDRRVVVAGEPWAIYLGRSVSIARNAVLHGPCYIGDETIVGPKAVVDDSIVGAHCVIASGAVVVGVEIPDGRFIPHGSRVDTADAVDALPLMDAHERDTGPSESTNVPTRDARRGRSVPSATDRF